MTEKMAQERVAGGYANYLKVGQNAFEFLLDFGQFYLEGEHADFHTRIITAPVYAKAFLKVLEDCILRYEQVYGSIPEELGALRLGEERADG
jgi:hypothetical protein